MYKIDMGGEVSEEFARCVSFAYQHLNMKGDGHLRWLKAGLSQPFLEHLSFELGNQAFFIRVDDVDGKVKGPGNPYGFRIIAEKCNGHACRMPMRRVGSKWEPAKPGWGLIDAGPIRVGKKLMIPFKDGLGEEVDPLSLVTDEKIEMTDWEVHDLAVQATCEFITKNRNCKTIQPQGNPSVYPSIWFDEGNGLQWVMVLEARHPDRAPFPTPQKLTEIVEFCNTNAGNPKHDVGYFMFVNIANFGDVVNPSRDDPSFPLWRGHRMSLQFDRGGLVPSEALLKAKNLPEYLRQTRSSTVGSVTATDQSDGKLA